MDGGQDRAQMFVVSLCVYYISCVRESKPLTSLQDAKSRVINLKNTNYVSDNKQTKRMEFCQCDINKIFFRGFRLGQTG